MWLVLAAAKLWVCVFSRLCLCAPARFNLSACYLLLGASGQRGRLRGAVSRGGIRLVLGLRCVRREAAHTPWVYTAAAGWLIFQKAEASTRCSTLNQLEQGGQKQIQAVPAARASAMTERRRQIPG